MNRWKVIAGILLIFILGAFCGVIGSGLFFKQRVQRFMDPAGSPPPIRFLKRQLDDFQLSVEQKAQIDALFAEMRREFTDLFRKTQPEFKALFDRYISHIRKELRPDQQEKLNRVVERLGRHMQRMKPPPPGGKGPFTGDRRLGPDPARRLDKLAWELDLSKDQVRQMRPILEKQWIRQRHLILEESTDGNRSDLKEKLRAIREETDQLLEAILTPEQVVSYKKLRRNRKP
jgi:hypothetical protein